MKITGEQRIAAKCERVWDALNDPAILVQSIPGCQSLEHDGENRFKATVEVKVGPISARFNGAVTLNDLVPPKSYTLVGQGQGGMAGSAKGSARVSLTDEGASTLLKYDVDAEVGGRLAQLGGPIIEATAKRLAAKFFRQFEEVLTGVAPAPELAGKLVGEPAAKAPAYIPPAATRPAGLPMAWLLAVALAAMTGFLIGRGAGDAGSDWVGLAIGLLLLIVGAVGVEFGRRSAAPLVVLDETLLARLAEGRRK